MRMCTPTRYSMATSRGGGGERSGDYFDVERDARDGCSGFSASQRYDERI